MGKETVWQRRARKRGSAKADYYPKVDLADEAGSDALERVEALAVAERPVEPESDVEAAEPAALELVAAESLEMADEPGPAEPELEALDAAELPAPEPESLALEPSEPELAASEPAEAFEAAAPVVDADAVKLPEFLDLAAAAPLVATLLERRGKPIVIDGSAVHQLGAQCVQVLLSAKRTWSADGAPLSIVNCAPRMIEDLQFLGIEPATLISGDLPQ